MTSQPTPTQRAVGLVTATLNYAGGRSTHELPWSFVQDEINEKPDLGVDPEVVVELI